MVIITNRNIFLKIYIIQKYNLFIQIYTQKHKKAITDIAEIRYSSTIKNSPFSHNVDKKRNNIYYVKLDVVFIVKFLFELTLILSPFGNNILRVFLKETI